ncbi:DEAD/DEAH box helicase [Saccharothrix luteola]|uniref:DEAD/DEAH box helicase n=1 Tax=Saccharothrix luteola TaxID=2893018 RepID=UPI001E3F9C58|nr:DEAD/DEAH box helicase [Saccharothrix luteola]MCC8246560.1 DEAD/DEAH box helicase [Saccharothrix luteola]MCC8248388.1 DEAD/DEAH box helicase [Saccharothrix luteola]
MERYAAVFEAADPPRTSTVAFYPAQDPPGPDGAPGSDRLTIATPDGAARTVPALRLPVSEAVPLLSRARRAPHAHPAAAFWGAAVVVALQLVARGRVRPAVTDGDFDAWLLGPLDAADHARVRDLADAMPAHARAVPLPGREPLELPDAEPLLRAFLDAVADTMPRGAAAVHAAGAPAFAATAPQRVPHLRDWADQGVRISLRIEGFGPFRAVVQVHSLADPARVVDAVELWASANQRSRADAMVALRRAARAWAPLERLLDQPVPDEVALLDSDVEHLLATGAVRLAAAGVDVHWPKDLVRDLSAKVVIGERPADRPAFFGPDHLTSVNWQLALGDDPLTPDELDRLAEATRPVVRLRDRWTLVDPELARRARERALKPVTAIDALGAALTGTTHVDGVEVEVAATGWLDELKSRLADLDDEPLAAPPALRATLRDYQLHGLRWLDRMTSLGLGACLADDMGLGKTITLIALHLHRDRHHPGPTLVVCPASLMGNWQREIERFAPGVPVRRFHGPRRDVAHEGFVLTTYGTMRLDADRLADVDWGMVVADEAQHVKNPASDTAKALRRIPARARVALTGTPVENTLSELWAILDWTTPGLLGTMAQFKARWAGPIEADHDQEAAQRFARLVRPFLLRRRKTDPGIAPELPPKTETDQPVALTREQAALYEAVVRELMAEVREADGIARRGRIVKLLTGLKQVCNHPAQYLKETSPKLAGRSGKLELLDELLDTILAEDGAVLVFTQYVAMARLIERHLAGRGIPSQLLHGGTPVPAREDMVRRFQDGECPVFLLSLKAAGTGLNLTRADHVVHYDRWWNPAVEDQATDRAHRIGQTRPVQVHRLIAEGTIEDRIAAMLRAKRDLADSVLARGDAAFTELSDDELGNLVELRSGT